MQSDGTKKTKSEHKMKRRWAGIVIVVAVIAIVAGFLWWQMSSQQPKLQLVNTTFEVEILQTEEDKIRGLSGTKSLAQNRAMLFDFEHEGTWGIWMKDMNYAIDIIWTDKDGKVIHIVKDAQPSSYPDTIFRPTAPARYVIETISGTIERTGLKMGDMITLPSGE